MGGIERGFMSTTTDHDVAMSYAAAGAGDQPIVGGSTEDDWSSDSSARGVLFEIEQGAIDRGADISMFSQYPHEREVLWPPLTSLQVTSSRVVGTATIVRVRANVNHTNLPIELSVSKRRKLVSEMCESMKAELRHEVNDVQWSELNELKPEAAREAVEQLD